MTDEERGQICINYEMTAPGEDMIIPDGVPVEDALIFVSHLQEIGYGMGR